MRRRNTIARVAELNSTNTIFSMSSARQRILIVEDEAAISTGLTDLFVFHGYEVVVVADGQAGLEQGISGGFDLILLDVMLPGMNGFEVCEGIRATDRDVAIVMLTAKISDEDIVNGLKLGADDYVGKPFGVQELVLRVEAVLRRSKKIAPERAEIRWHDEAVVDCDNLSGNINGKKLAFTRREMELLRYLAANSARPVSRDELLAAVWGYREDVAIETRTVDIHIAKLRRKIEHKAKSPERLITVRGAGYRLVLPE